MLRESIKHGISEALSGRPGFDVWDFDLKQSRKDDEVKLEIRFRYQPELVFRATLGPRPQELVGIEVVESGDGNESYAVSTAADGLLAISVESVPGELLSEEKSVAEGLEGLYDAVAIWVGRIETELEAVAANRVRMAQQKALAELGQIVAGVPDRRPSTERVRRLQARLDDLEAAVLKLRGHSADDDGDEEVDAIRDEFAALKQRAGMFTERSFFQALLVRLVKYFWDDQNLRLVESAKDAAARLLDDRASAEVPVVTRLRTSAGAALPG